MSNIYNGHVDNYALVITILRSIQTLTGGGLVLEFNSGSFLSEFDKLIRARRIEGYQQEESMCKLLLLFTER
jgi:hypothetical protein